MGGDVGLIFVPFDEAPRDERRALPIGDSLLDHRNQRCDRFCHGLGSSSSTMPLFAVIIPSCTFRIAAVRSALSGTFSQMHATNRFAAIRISVMRSICFELG